MKYVGRKFFLKRLKNNHLKTDSQKTIPDEDLLYTSKEVMQVLSIGKNKLTGMRAEGSIVYYKIGRFAFRYPKKQFTLEAIAKKELGKKNYFLKVGK